MVASLTDIVQVEAVRVVAGQALEEGVAVLGGPVACLHQLACNQQMLEPVGKPPSKRPRKTILPGA